MVSERMIDKGPSTRIPGTSVDELIEATVSRFLKQKTYDHTLPTHPLHGKVLSGFTISVASFIEMEDRRNSGEDMRGIAAMLLLNTDTSPRRIAWDGGVGENWEAVSEFIARNILELEVQAKHPELLEEDSRRLNFYREYKKPLNPVIKNNI